MTNFSILLKNNFNILLGTLQGKRQRKSTIVATILLVLGIVGILAIYSLQTITMFDGLGMIENGKLVMFHASTTCISVLIIIGAMRTSTTSKTNDNDLLLSLPIRKRDIILSKTINKYAFDMFFTVLMFLPYVIIYQIKVAFDIGVLLLGILLTLILPLLSIGISYILDFIISRIFNRTRFASFLKSITLVLIFVLVLGLMLVKTSTYGSVQAMGSFDFSSYLAERPLSNLIINFMFNPNGLNIFLICLLTLVPFVIGLCLYAVNFGKTFNAINVSKKELKFNDKKSSFGLLLKKELYNYGNTTAYIVNTIIGAILILVVGIFLAITGIDGLQNMLGGMAIPKELLVGILVLVFCGANSTCLISPSTVSLEGKNFWILKTSPVNPNTLLLSKSLLQIIIVVPFLLISSILAWIGLSLTFFEFLMVFTLPLIHNLIISFAGVLINLWIPNFEWENETKVVKQSMAVTLTMVLGFLLTLALFGIYQLFTGSLSIANIYLICLAAYLLILGVFVLLLFTKGKKMYERL